jgi:anaerobic ribonucleoside-triphosphate reductase activating protein
MLEDREESIIETQAIIDEILATDGIEGVTLIGGEPFWQSRELAQLATAVRAADLGVMVFTGLTIELLKRRAHPHDLAFLDQIDLLIDGPYVQSKRDLSRRWIGSSNQRAHFLTPRYQYLQDEVWGRGSKNTVELRMVGSQITINGWPDLDVVALSEASIKPVKKAGEP